MGESTLQLFKDSKPISGHDVSLSAPGSAVSDDEDDDDVPDATGAGAAAGGVTEEHVLDSKTGRVRRRVVFGTELPDGDDDDVDDDDDDDEDEVERDSDYNSSDSEAAEDRRIKSGVQPKPAKAMLLQDASKAAKGKAPAPAASDADPKELAKLMMGKKAKRLYSRMQVIQLLWIRVDWLEGESMA